MVTDEYGFSALAGGDRTLSSSGIESFYGLGTRIGYWWASANRSEEYKPVKNISGGESRMGGMGNKSETIGYSVRCIQE
jgi:uncharacterized protein (TIGR02145 family)